jgi:hypothetical protein
VAKIKPRDFAKPKEGMTLVVVCRDSRMKASAGCPHTISIYMSDEKYNALGFCRIHGGGEIKPINETPYNPNSNVKPSVTPSEIPNNEVEDLPYNDGVIKDEPADAPPATSEPPQTDAPAENIIHEEPQNTPSEEPVNEPVKNEKIQDEPGNY